MRCLPALALVWAGAVSADGLPPADIYVLGEIHDNPVHHEVQARLVEELSPNAIVFEMLTEDQAGHLNPSVPRDPQALDEVLGWSETGWPDIAMYAPIMANPDTPILGAAGEVGDLAGYGLDAPLPPAQQAEREQLQADAHCGALPEDLLPQFVARQRQIDAQFAARTLAALAEYGAPVVLITGNGHARKDWGVPAAIERVRPDVTVLAVVQGEDGRVPPGGDVVFDAPAPDRPDPCEAFR
ncbi:MAG: ChaN family lipoprotein [Pseudomonadota bacterium]